MAAQYHSIFTEQGLSLLREAIQNGTKLGITQMSFGDGNGLVPEPDATFTHLVNEIYRTDLNRLAPSANNPNWLEADAVIPSAVGGFNIREVGLWAGEILVAYSNYPPTYKPTADQGTAQIKTIRIVLQIDNTANFELKIDASVVMATIQAVEDAKNEAKSSAIEYTDQIWTENIEKFKQPEMKAVEQNLIERFKKKQYVGDYEDIHSAVAAQRSKTTCLSVETNSTYTLESILNLKGYSFLRGAGFYSRIKCKPGTGIVYSPTDVADDHAQRRLSDLQIVGDGTIGDYVSPKNGTTTGYSWNGGAFAETSGNLFNAHGTGFKIQNSYTNLNRYNYYRANKIGLHLENITSHREEMIYGRFNSIAAFLITNSMQNVTIAGGAIEGNIGRGIWIKDLQASSFPKLTLDDVYFESNGDLSAGIPAIDIQNHPKMHTSVRAGSYWNNVLSGITTGAYRWGRSVDFDNSTLNGFHFADITRVVNGIDSAAYNTGNNPATMALLGYSEPTMMLEYLPTYRVDGYGPVFRVPFGARTTRKFLQPNEITAAYPHISIKGNNTLISENQSLDYGDGSWTDISFSGSGDFNTNFAQLTDLVDAESAYIGKVFVFLLKPSTDCKIGLVTTGALNSMQSYFLLKAGVTYRMCMVHNRSGAGNFRTRLFSTDGPANISYLPIHLAKFLTTFEALNFANMFCRGVL
ncbi:phage tail protein [Acinetobacter baumannii]|uniref:phage tail protein n=1 Tax=Acinetobacter baumannii TaxID=470 RepID=UPI000DE63E81|nr:phage tail protein [Acinetobacter baumannii]SSR09195.1 phage-like tail fiber protein [Acinetobacter baumannii]